MMMTANSEVLRALELHVIKPNSTKSTEIGGGCVNGAYKYETSDGPVFVKINQNPAVDPLTMFVGEAASLQHILAATTSYGASFAPKPLFHGPLSKGAFLATSYIPLTAPTKRHQVELARRLATMHASDPPPECVGLGFGFPVPTMLGTTHQDNTWELDWVSFYRRRFKAMIDKVLCNYRQDFELQRLGDAVCAKMPEFFAGCDEIKPSLIHGDLWSGNWGVNSETDLPVIFDPACCYAHNELELSIMRMFGGFSSDFFDEYHKHFPKQPGFERRQELYQAYHYLNHMFLFGTGYRSSSMSLLRSLAQSLSS